MFDGHVAALADDALVARVGRTDEIRRQLQHRVGVERGRQPLVGQLDAITLDARETNLQMVPVRSNRLHLHGLPRRLRRRDDRLGGEVERHAEDVGVLGVEQAVFVQVVRLATERAADHLLAEKLRAEGADAEDVGDGVGVPAFGEHGDRHDAADAGAELVLLADRVHDLAQQLLVGDVLGGARVAGALDDLAAEALDLVRGHRAEVVVERIAGFELLGVDEQRVGPRQRVAGGLVEVAEQRQAAVLERGRAVLVLAVEAGDVVVDQLRDGGVLADDDEAGRDGDAALLPQLEGLLVVAVERLERGLQPRRQLQRIEVAAGAAPLLRHVLADVLPEVAVDRHLVAGDVLRDRHARQLDDAALDGVHQREVAHRPGEERAFGVAGAAQEERRGREVEDAREPERAVHGFETGDPQAGGLVVLLGFLPLVALQRPRRPDPAASRGSSGAPRR